MDLSLYMNSTDKLKTQMQVNNLNKQLGNGAEKQQELGKDDFLKLLITQLTHQDPTKPMEDREFIAQMAQFSTLEQMTNMNSEFQSLSNMLLTSQTLGLLGREVEIADGEQTVRGIVEEVAGREVPRVLVDGKYYDAAKVDKVR